MCEGLHRLREAPAEFPNSSLADNPHISSSNIWNHRVKRGE
jgi:hypothetical protein